MEPPPAPPPQSLLSVETKPISWLIPYPGNARKRTQAAINNLAHLLELYGWRQPIAAEENGYILMGHGRRLAALQLGWTEAPVHIVRGLSPEKLRALRIADNKSAEGSSWDESLLTTELLDLKGFNFDLTGTGFASTEIDDLLSGKGIKKSKAARNAPEPKSANTPVISYNIIFNSEDDQRVWFDFLKLLRTQYPEVPTVSERIVKYCLANKPQTTA
jgi:hypothetical protein